VFKNKLDFQKKSDDRRLRNGESMEHCELVEYRNRRFERKRASWQTTSMQELRDLRSKVVNVQEEVEL
jgi:hypothetical protein